MKKIFIVGISIVISYSILVYAYGFDCQGPLNSSTNYTLNSGVTPTTSGQYYVGCGLDDVASVVRIVVTNEKTGLDELNILDYDVKNSHHYFYARKDTNYAVYVSSVDVTGWALCEPAN